MKSVPLYQLAPSTINSRIVPMCRMHAERCNKDHFRPLTAEETAVYEIMEEV